MPEHPHVDATYKLITQADGTFAVEVSIPETQPTKVTGFDTEAKAEAWIERHKSQIATGTLSSPRPSWGRGRKPTR